MSFALIIKTAEDRAAEALAAHQTAVAAAIDAHVEAQARALGYNNASACAGYKDSTVPAWAAEAAAFIAWRDAVWLAAYGAQSAHAGAGTMPEAAEILAVLPVWGG